MSSLITFSWTVRYGIHEKDISPNVEEKRDEWIFNYPCKDGADQKCSFYEVFLTPGIWYLEAIGASGGDIIGFRGHGGKGSRANGTLHLRTTKLFQFRIGGAGNSYVANTGIHSPGGYNGGGNSPGSASGGGGSSDVRLDDSLQSRIMVSAGGGGSNDDNDGGNGGELVGYWRGTSNDGGPGTQTNGGSGFPSGRFGFGGGDFNGYEGGGGGGGFFGGGKANILPYSGNSVGGGGSSYVSGYPGCHSVDQNGVSTDFPVHYSRLKFSNPQMQGGVNIGNGRIILRLIKSLTKKHRIDQKVQLFFIRTMNLIL